MCLGIGILRFSYTALLPVTRESYAWSSTFASLLGSANLLGYLIGAFWAMKLPQNKNMVFYIQFAVCAGAISLLSCAFSGLNESWYLFWRIISGISGGLLMILSPSVVAQCCAPEQRLSINFIGFSGIGLGVLFATLFLPYLDHITTQTAWLLLFSIASLICVFLLLLLKQFKAHLNEQEASHTESIQMNHLFLSLLMVYASSAFAYVPHSLFWIDYLTRSLHLNLYWINFNWILYGTGSALGAITAYLLAKKWGNFPALKILYSTYIIAIFIATFDFSPLLTFMSSFLTGLLNPAVVFLTSYTILHLFTHAYKKLWSLATLAFALTQLIGGLTFSGLQSIGVSYHHQFLLAAFVLAVGTLQFYWFANHSKPTQYKQK